MSGIRFWLRQAGAASKTDSALQLLRIVAIIYQIGFALYLPLSKYKSLDTSIRYIWFGFYVVALLYAQVLPYLPKQSRSKWTRVEAARLRSTNVAVAQITGCIREGRFSDVDFVNIAVRLLVVIRQEVEAITLDPGGTFINATLMIEDPYNPDSLRVLCRANADRNNPSYKKSNLAVWKAMQTQTKEYVPRFEMEGKDYHCILALPLVIETEAGDDISIGVVSIDSGQANDFDGVVDRIEIRLLPYLSLLKLALSMKTLRREDG